jgi:hypothetical protein
MAEDYQFHFDEPANGHYDIPRCVTSISDNAFEECSGLTSVTIPQGVTSIGVRAFYECRGLTSVTILQGMTSIGNGAFTRCSGLTSVIFPHQLHLDLFEVINDMTRVPLTALVCKKRKLQLSETEAGSILCLIMICKISFEVPFEMIEHILSFLTVDRLIMYRK